MTRLVHFILPLLLGLGAAIASFSGWYSSLDYLLYDRVQSFNKVPAQDDVLIVAIDESSADQLGRWPWPRKRHAELLDVLTDAGVRAVFFDVLFSEPDLREPKNDISLAKAIRRNGRVILPVHFESIREQGQTVEIPPLAMFAEHAAAIGHAHVDCSIKLCRSVYLKEGVGSPHWPHMALALYNFTHKDLKEAVVQLPGLRAKEEVAYSPMLIYRDFKNFIPFSTEGNTAYVSYKDVLSGKISEALLKDKVIFIGATATGIHDVVATPSGRMAGVTLNSLVYQAIRSNKLSREMEPHYKAWFTFLCVFIFLSLFSFLRPSLFLLVTISCSVMVVSITTLVLLNANVWFPPLAVLVSFFVFYPLWSWLRIEFALRFLHRSLLRIQAEQRGGHVYGTDNEQGVMLPSNERLSTILFGAHFSVESRLRGTEIVTKTIEQFRIANRGLESARQLVLQSLSNLQEAVIIFNKNGALVLKNKYAHTLFPNTEEAFRVEHLGCSLVLGEALSWDEVVADLGRGESEINIEGYIRRDGITRDEESQRQVDLYIQGRSIVISRPSTNVASATATTNILLFTFTDITTLKNSERSRMETLDFISHDLRSPMVSIVALIEKQRLTNKGGAYDFKILDDIEKYAKRNLNYAQSLLHLSRAEAVSADHYTNNDMHAIVDAAYVQAIALAEQKNIRLELKRDDLGLWVLADTDLLERALINLITNAIKYSEENTQVTVSLVKTLDNVVAVHVSDQGPGVNDKHKAALFKRFKRGEHKTGEEGAGLGLFFVKTVADKHGGSITMNNNTTTCGATFTLSLPLLPSIE